MLSLFPGTQEDEDPIDGTSWDKGFLLEAELVERCDLDHFLPEKLYFGYSRDLSLLAHLCLLARAEFYGDSFVATLFIGAAREAARTGSEWGVCPPWAVPV